MTPGKPVRIEPALHAILERHAKAAGIRVSEAVNCYLYGSLSAVERDEYRANTHRTKHYA